MDIYVYRNYIHIIDFTFEHNLFVYFSQSVCSLKKVEF